MATLISSLPIAVNLKFAHGNSFAWGTELFADDGVTPFDPTGFTAKIQFRARIGQDPVLLELNTENGGASFVTDGTNWTLQATITPDQSASLPANRAMHYSKQITKDTQKQDVTAGTAVAQAEATQ